jgi:hypothetical protein
MAMSVIPEEEYKEVEVNFTQTVAPGAGVRVTRTLNYDGQITHVLFNFPPGLNGLVDVRLLKDEKPFYPLNGYLALDDCTPIFYMNVAYYKKEPLTVEILNRDATNSHSPTVSVSIRYKKPRWEEG